MHFLTAIVGAALVGLLGAYPAGPPMGTCSTLKPGSPHGSLVQSGNGGFMIATDLKSHGNCFLYKAGKTYKVILVGTKNTFRGFMVQAQSPSSNNILLGSFLPDSSATQEVMSCQDGMGNAAESTVGQSNSEKKDFQKQEFTWQAPSERNGIVEFFYTVVQTKPVFYVGLKASENMIALDEVPDTLKDEAEWERIDSFQDEIANNSSTGLVFRIPSGCVVDSKCTVSVRVTRNSDPSLLTFHFTGTAKAWVAIGFTKTPNMLSADVFACNVNPDTHMVEALDTWNDNSYNNAPNVDQSNITLLSGSFSDGRIVCSLTRTISGDGNSSEDLNLNDNYYVLYGRGNEPVAGRLLSHLNTAPLPSISAREVNPVTDAGVESASNFENIKLILIKTHGILMLIAWPLLASTAIFFAMYMRPVLPKGEWFQVHRAFMLGSLFIAAVAFILIFVSQSHNSTPGLISLNEGKRITHFVFGIILMFLQILNPILAAFRCGPKAEKRWIFNIFHGKLVGLIAEILAYVNIGIGIALFTDSFSIFAASGAPIWLYVSYIVVIVLLFAVCIPFIIHWTKLKKVMKKEKSPEEIELKKRDESEEVAVPDKQLISFNVAWGSLGVFTGLTLVVILVLIILIAI